MGQQGGWGALEEYPQQGWLQQAAFLGRPRQGRGPRAGEGEWGITIPAGSPRREGSTGMITQRWQDTPCAEDCSPIHKAEHRRPGHFRGCFCLQQAGGAGIGPPRVSEILRAQLPLSCAGSKVVLPFLPPELFMYFSAGARLTSNEHLHLLSNSWIC